MLIEWHWPTWTLWASSSSSVKWGYLYKPHKDVVKFKLNNAYKASRAQWMPNNFLLFIDYLCVYYYLLCHSPCFEHFVSFNSFNPFFRINPTIIIILQTRKGSVKRFNKLFELTLLLYGGSEIWMQVVCHRFYYLNHSFLSYLPLTKKDENAIRIEWEDRLPSHFFFLELESILLLIRAFVQEGI